MRNDLNGNIRDKEFIPVSIRTSLEVEPYWGRVITLGPEKLELLSKFEFRKGRVLALDFELDKEKLEEVRGTVTAVIRDRCGYFQYSIKLSDRNQQKTIQEKLFQLVAKT